jgi:L-ascorbate metabolism protein UlaG (beta-lactamase superfamily)
MATRFCMAGEAAGYVLHLPDGRTLYFAGDTAVFSDMQLIETLYKPELAFLPIGDFYTMGPREAALACRLLNVKKAIPMHFGTFPALSGTPAELARELKEFPRTEVWPLEIGKPAKW